MVTCMVTGSTAGTTAADIAVDKSDGIHDQLSVPEQADHSTSLESLSKLHKRNEHANQSIILESYVQNNWNNAVNTLVHCPTDHAIGS